MPSEKSKVKIPLDRNTLNRLISGLEKINNSADLTDHVTLDSKEDLNDLNGILNSLLSAVTVLTIKMAGLSVIKSKSMDSAVASAQHIREQSDELDEIRQRSMKGNLILSGVAFEGKKNPLRPDEELSGKAEGLLQHVTGLIDKKYGVVVPRGDVQACHRLTNGSVLLRIWNRCPGSAWSELISSIKTGGRDKDLKFFANFQLTKPRSNLMYQMRKFHKEKKIAKIFCNENGQLSYKTTQDDKKTRITFFKTKTTASPKTLTIEEFHSAFEKSA